MNRLATAIEPVWGSFFTDRTCHHPSKYATENNLKTEVFLPKTGLNDGKFVKLWGKTVFANRQI
jgi:hypothetical protein